MLNFRHHLNQSLTAYAQSHAINTSIYKAKLVASLVRNMSVDQALLQLEFSKKSIAAYMLQVLRSAIANAENNKSLDIDKLYISEILINKAFYLKRFEARARGRGSSKRKPFTKITIFVTQRG
jgi:large subunit ribosomal protein L22